MANIGVDFQKVGPKITLVVLTGSLVQTQDLAEDILTIHKYQICLIQRTLKFILPTETKTIKILFYTISACEKMKTLSVILVVYFVQNVGGLRQGTMTWLNLADCKKIHSPPVTFQSAELGCAHNPGKTTLCSVSRH